MQKQLRALSPRLENLKIKNITLSKSGRAVFDLICDKAISEEDKILIKNKIKSVIPPSFDDIVINVTKIVADGELVAREIISYLLNAHMSVAHSLTESNVSFCVINGVYEYTLSLDSDIYGYFDDNDVCEDVSNHLEEYFCGKFVGRIVDTGRTVGDPTILEDKINTADYETIKCRSFEVTDVVKIWGEEIGN